MSRDDFVGELVALATTAGVDQNVIERLEAEIRRRWGGQSVAIRRERPVTLDDINDRLRQRKPVRVIADELGMSRATVYRRLSIKRR